MSWREGCYWENGNIEGREVGSKSSDLLRFLQGVVEELLLMATPQTCIFDLMPTSATIVPLIGIIGSLKIVWILHSK